VESDIGFFSNFNSCKHHPHLGQKRN